MQDLGDCQDDLVGNIQVVDTTDTELLFAVSHGGERTCKSGALVGKLNDPQCSGSFSVLLTHMIEVPKNTMDGKTLVG